MSVTIEDAIMAAAKLHRGQVDKAGQPYILHPLRVMLSVASDEARIAAVLHDVPEDVGWPALHRVLGELPPWLRDALDALTRREGEQYEAFVERAGMNPLARTVKLADLADNMRLDRIPNPTDRDRERIEKYRRAVAALTGR